MSTLLVYLENNCEIALTPRKLYVHRKTVKYRIAKCEEILGYSIHYSENSLHLRTALLMRGMFTEQEHYIPQLHRIHYCKHISIK